MQKDRFMHLWIVIAIWHLDATEKAVKIFHHDPQIGAVTGHGRVRNSQKEAHLIISWKKLQDVYVDGACRAKRVGNCFFFSYLLFRSLSFYRREAIQDFIHEWAHDRFLGDGI